jgi:hypothetical protein
MSVKETLVRARGSLDARRHDLSSVERFVVFVGWPRSAHSLVGSLLTAHPDAVVAHELNALRYVRDGISRRALFGLLLRRDRTFAEAGSQWYGYDYSVPGQWQGRYRRLRVIGDKKGGNTARLLAAQPELFGDLCRLVEVPVQVVVVTRHPLDNIARMVAAPKRAAPAEADEAALAREETAFFTMAAAVERLAGETDIHWMGHEDFVSDPVAGLTGLLGRLDLDVDDDYVTAATSIVNDSPRLARHAISWPDGQCQSIMERASAFAFLRRYC